jgi:hypothetical protein
MRVTLYDLTFYNAMHAPAWSRRLRNTPEARRALHEAINERPYKEGPRADYEREAYGALHVLRSVRKRQLVTIRDHMARAAKEYARIQPKRAATYTRWLRQMRKANTR